MPWHFWSQTLAQRRTPGGRLSDQDGAGPMWRHGRCWLTRSAAPDADAAGPRLRLEWQIPSRHVGAQLTVHNTDEDDVSMHFGCGLFALWAGIGGVFPASWRYRTDARGHYLEARQTGLGVFDWALWWDVWHSVHSWSTRTPRWRSGSWHPLETLLGRMLYSTSEGQRWRADIPLPEGPMPATFAFERAEWCRPRWPRWPLRRALERVEVTPDQPIPVPGKGESEWNCGDDAMHSISFPCQTVEQAIGHVVQDVLRTRLRHGGSLDWQPRVTSGP